MDKLERARDKCSGWAISYPFHTFDKMYPFTTENISGYIDKFDLEQPVMFSTYAVPMISGEIKRFIRDDGMIKISRTIKENSQKIKTASRILAQNLGREATIEELSEETGIEKGDIVVALESVNEVESIYRTVYQGEGNDVFLVDKLAASKESGDNENLVNKLMLEQIINNLSEMEREIIILRYYEEKTQVQVAEKLGISQVQVSRMEKKILLNMREQVKN